MKSSATVVNVLAAIGVIAAVALLTAGGVAIAGGIGDDDTDSPPTAATTPATTIAVDQDDLQPDADDQPLTAAETDRVAAAAKRIAGQDSTVVEVDRSDDLGEAYEVEVLTPQGELDIALDERLERVPNLRYDD
jgi:hypothetical protein